MRNEYSVINDLYGTETARRQPKRESSLGLVIFLALAGMFLYESVHPVMRLQSEPPPLFLKGMSARRAMKSGYQDTVARSYWGVAADYVSTKYSYGQLLPSNPPADFTTTVGDDYATRDLYWQRLRGLWNQPEVWVRSYYLDTGWIDSALGSLGKVVRNYLNG